MPIASYYHPYYCTINTKPIVAKPYLPIKILLLQNNIDSPIITYFSGYLYSKINISNLSQKTQWKLHAQHSFARSTFFGTSYQVFPHQSLL